MDPNHLKVETRGAVALITLNRPEKLNCLDVSLARDLTRVVKEAASSESVRALLITGAGRAFSAGGDIREMSRGLRDGSPETLIHSLVGAVNAAIQAIQKTPKPVVAALNGVAAGAGLGLALACDLRVAVSGAELITAFKDLGLSPDSSTSYFLPRLVGLSKAVEILFLNRPLRAEEALEHGLIYKVVSPERFAEESLNVAELLARGPTQAFGRTKRLMACSLSSTLPEQLDLEGDLVTASSMTDDFREGVTSFLERRQPEFKGQ